MYKNLFLFLCTKKVQRIETTGNFVSNKVEINIFSVK